MIASKSKSLNAALPLVMIVGLLSGCAEHLETHQTDNPVVGGYRHVFHHAKWQQGKEPYKNYVEPITLSHDVLFQSGQATITSAGRMALHEFLRAESVGSDEQVLLRAPGSANGNLTPLNTARLAALKTELERNGLAVAVAKVGDSDGLSESDQVAVSVTRMMVLSPDCKVPPPEPGGRPDYRWSCSDTVNLGAMVANPEDLKHGRDFEPSDGEALAHGIENYRMGDIEEIVIEETD